MENRYFVYDGETLVAAQHSLNGARRYYKEGRQVFQGTPDKHNTDVTKVVAKMSMWILRDNPLSIIPALTQYGVTRCNITQCPDKPTTICIHAEATFGLCEQHYQSFNGKIVDLKLEF